MHFSLPPMRVTCPAHSFIFNFITKENYDAASRIRSDVSLLVTVVNTIHVKALETVLLQMKSL
jgi:hypothetical protein